ncbi:biotin-dependent carboxyltransferase [Spongiibacter sp. KMU-158]|uniref:Biotin-dependent carboxyltransferase n=1 Tax=Spongiibacter pelagi TaxID=2760804 RepID=A0A927C4P7_9GAMM|nr:biotin-dependent carboxyltransferase family protein [Spongiibacter pelagi]MBD2859842.1 biotin-dependent carboxyltransferase [Spongiibacter pelagi]
MSFTIKKAGPLTLLQDAGRFGFQHIGIGVGGPADERAFAWANHLLSNPYNTATLEITLGPFELLANAATQIALAGADMAATLNGKAIANWSTHTLSAGDTLFLYPAKQGLRAYLAVVGGFHCQPVFGSCSTAMREKLGGLSGQGAAIKSGDSLEFTASAQRLKRQVPPDFIPDYTAPLSLGLLPSYQYGQFTNAALDVFLNNEFQVSAESNRMGYRLNGPAVEAPQGELVSEGISLGAIQITPAGQPIVLLQDRQTMGGYPKIGCISALDAARLGQCRPGSRLRFYLSKMEDAIGERERFNRFFGV